MRLLMANTRGWKPEMYAAFEALGFQLVFLGGTEEKTYDMDFSDIDGVICYRFFCYNDIRQFSSLKYIHTTSAGIDHMPMDYIREKGICLINARGVFSAPMAEFALGGVLQLYKNALSFRKKQQNHFWRQEFPLRELDGKTVTLLGAGSIAAETARRFSAMGCTVTGLCRHPAPTEHFDRVLSISQLDAVLPDSDIVILALPLTEETRHLFDASRFARMKRGSVFVNIARGPITDTAALLAALQDGTLSGAVVDVFEEEPLPPDSPLWDQENLILTPHNSFAGEFNTRRMFRLIYDDTVRWLDENKEN
ncbi:MAG: NAD(P)-dependent oxidoreductase [Oscillospiraceae bacterium]